MLFQESLFQPVLKTLFSKFSGGAFPQTPPEWSIIFCAAARLQLFLARNLTLNYYKKLANMYRNRFLTILYIISDDSLITLMKSGMTTKYWFVKITESFTSFVLCFLNVLFIIQAILVLKKNIKFFSLRGKFSRQLPTLLCAIPIVAHFYC